MRPKTSTPGRAESCVLCKKLLPVLQKTTQDHVSLDLGPFDQVCSFGCDSCRPLIEWLFDWFKPLETTQSLHFFQDCFSSSFYFHLGNHYDTTSPRFDVTESEDKNQYPGYGVKVDPRWIDDAVLMQWYESCINTHGSKCQDPPYLELLPIPNPRYFIDTVNNCLIAAPSDSSYVSLSYVWGQVDITKLLTFNLDQLKRPGALDGPARLVSLPKTIRQAMHLTRRLGERYLWVDSLCIVQDDEESQNEHLSRMASIYAHASVVIVPIDGENAESGIRGLKNAPSAEPRHFEKEVIPFWGRGIVKRTVFSQDGRPPSRANKKYFDRGWTFQEFLFARRRICFENDSVWFQCCHSTAFEDHSHPGLPYKERDFILDVGYPSLTVYSRLVEDFNRRQLRYPQDCLSAIAGMLPCYTKVFKGGFLYGLPEMFFDAALLWQPGGDLARRVPAETDKRYKFADEQLPSWSWIGWQGQLDFQGWATANDFVAACSGWIASSRLQTCPVTTWYTSSDAFGAAARRKIDVEWATWRERYKSPANELPQGWTRWKRRDAEILTISEFPAGYGQDIYQHESCGAKFWYPVPLSDTDAQPSPNSQTAFLSASVETARLFASRPIYTKNGTVRITLVNSQNEWAGILRLHSRDYFSNRGLDPEESRIELQLIAISRGSIPNGLGKNYGYDLEEYNIEQRSDDGELYEYYNVMWVTWKEGIAFREALGRVHKRMWRSLNPSNIDIVLG